ncbi:MAG: cupin domain-containing protein [Pseudomonadota bacterium]
MSKVRAGSLGEALPAPGGPEHFNTLVRSGMARVERIVSHGHASATGAWYDQDWDEFVLVVTGSAALAIEGEATARQLRPGDWVFLPRRTRHRVDATDADGPTVWLAVHVGEAGGKAAAG